MNATQGALVLGAVLLAACSDSSRVEPIPDSGVLQLVDELPLTPRLTELSFRTPALGQETQVRVLLPRDYRPGAERRYPVLYLLHGGGDDRTSWTRTGAGEAEALTEALPLIVVMPDAGRSAWYTDWYNNGAFGVPMLETFHVQQLIPWVDAHYATVAQREGRAVVGLSSGGFGAMSYAARHPDLFISAAAFSGAVDTNTPAVIGPHAIDALSLQDGGPPGSLWGLRETEEVRWRGHNPWDLAENLRTVGLTVRTGNGDAGGAFGGGGPTDPGGAGLERVVHEQNLSFHARLQALGIKHVWDDYGAGTHSWPYWNEALRRTLPQLMSIFADPPVAPDTFTYTAIEPVYEVFGWRVALDRAALEFSTLRVVPGGFVLFGSGIASVTTARLYEPGKHYRVVIRNPDSGEISGSAQADPLGCLQLRVPLGPANSAQQHYTPDGQSPMTRVFSVRVVVSSP